MYPNELVIFGAHFDSSSDKDGGNSSAFAPGAIDNASGTAAVMLVAKVFADQKFARTVQFVFMTGEVQGLYGSTAYADWLASLHDWHVKAVLILDSVAYTEHPYFGVGFSSNSNLASTDLVWGGMQAVEDIQRYFNEDFSFGTNLGAYGTDDVPFQRVGFPAIMLSNRLFKNYPGMPTSQV
ncbi:hypothetical protein DIPPA_31824 [Diplonema papillatum]|nr:hypothetical protein DIPPA_31824 [Diplonema papillatum]